MRQTGRDDDEADSHQAPSRANFTRSRDPMPSGVSGNGPEASTGKQRPQVGRELRARQLAVDLAPGRELKDEMGVPGDQSGLAPLRTERLFLLFLVGTLVLDGGALRGRLNARYQRAG